MCSFINSNPTKKQFAQSMLEKILSEWVTKPNIKTLTPIGGKNQQTVEMELPNYWNEWLPDNEKH